jgi:GntR family transcriptional regulator
MAQMKYEIVANDLIDAIRTGVYKPSEQLPSIEALCEMYEVSKMTIKKSLDVLQDAGYITRRRGSGSFVKNVQAPIHKVAFETSGQMSGLTAEQGAAGIKITTEVIDFGVEPPSPEVAHMLALESDQFVYRICRVRFADDRPHAVEYTHMPIDLIPNLRRKNAEGSIYSYIEGDLRLRIASAHRIVRAVLPTKEEQKWMKVGPHEPLLEVEQVAFLDDGTPFEYSFSRHPNGYEFRSISTK